MQKNRFGRLGVFSGRSIFSRVFIPIMALLIIQAALYSIVFWRGNVIKHIEQNAFDIFNEHTVNSSQNMQNNLTRISASLEENADVLSALIEGIITGSEHTCSDVFTDSDLNQKIISDISPTLVNILHRNDINGIFVVLDGPLTRAPFPEESPRAGIYIRNLNGGMVSSDNSNLLLERGLPEISRKLGIALDTFWTAGFEFDDEESKAGEFFFDPINAARSNSGMGKPAYYGKWCGCYSMSESDIEICSYSIPLITKNKTVIGVVGMDVTRHSLLEMMPYQNLSKDGNSAYFLGITRDGGASYQRAADNGSIYKYHFGNSDYIRPEQHYASHPDIFKTTDPEGCSFFGVAKPLRLYNSNTPFENEQWALIGLSPQDVLFAFSKYISNAAMLSLMLSLMVGIVGIWMVAHLFTTPIRNLVQELRTSNPWERIYLRRLGIAEIDELTASIENLSTQIADTSERTARIFSIAPIPIGVFEYNRRTSAVFCSIGLCKLLNWPEVSDKDYIFLDRHDFESRITEINRNLLQSEHLQFSIALKDKTTRWLRSDIVEQDNIIVGAVTDITDQIASKRRMEYERDYDPLTNLYNLRAFTSRFNQLFAAEDLQSACLIMWDLDNLKHINDTYGHDFGDRYIKAFSECLELFSEHNALVARRSGDEFYTFIYGYPSADEINDIIESVWYEMESKSISLPDGSRYRIRVSGGIAWYPTDTNDRDDLLRFADFAMYQAKHNLKGTIKGFDRRAYLDNVHIIDGYEVISGLIEGELVRFAMQPIVSARDGSIFGYEMLMRPQIPGDYSPLDILKMAQTHSKLYHIERISLFKGMHTFIEQVIYKKIPENALVFVNSIANQILNDEDMERFETTFTKYLDKIVIEITEGEQDIDEFSRRKSEIAGRWNAKIAVDDYGSGYNSESMLIEMHPDIVKVDMSILHGIDKDQNRQIMLESLISYAKKFNVAVLAEGIETQQELETVIARGVDYIQGYFVANPSFEPHPISAEVVKAITEAAKKAAEL